MGLSEFIAQAPTDHFLLGTVIAAVAAVLAFVGGFVMLYRARLIENTPTSRVRSASQGYAELAGLMSLMPGDPIVCPLTASRCCWWNYAVEERQTRYSNGKRRTEWITVDSGTSDALFLLKDDTGECVIDPEGATVIPNKKRRWYGSSRRPRNAPVSGGGVLGGLLGSAFSSYRYTEELLFPGRPIYAIGLFRTHGDGGVVQSIDQDVRELLAKWKRDPKMRALLDVNKDGELDAREWEAATRLAEKRARSEQSTHAPLPDTHLLSKPPGRRPFLLSALTEAQLVRRYRLYGWAALAGFLAAVGLLVFALEARGLM